MAKNNSYFGSFVINGNAVAEYEDGSLDETARMFLGVAKGEAREQGRAGPITGKMSVTMFTDPSDINGQNALSIGATITNLEMYLDGSSTGDHYYTVAEAVVESVGITNPQDYSKKSVGLHLNSEVIPAVVP